VQIQMQPRGTARQVTVAGAAQDFEAAEQVVEERTCSKCSRDCPHLRWPIFKKVMP
jgi:hypothetical protein